MDNYDFCAKWAADNMPAGARVLDYGCGAGQIVEKMADAGIDAHGCDLFYATGDLSGKVPDRLWGRIARMENGRIPFPDSHFDAVLSNQVFEHVEDLHSVLAEIHRVLKPGGRMLCVFPHLEVWREVHGGVPFLHWFAKNSTPRVYYSFLWAASGAGRGKQGQSKLTWAREYCKFIDDWTHYRSLKDLDGHFKQRFPLVRYLEPQWLDCRLERAPILKKMPGWLKRFTARKMAGVVVETAKA